MLPDNLNYKKIPTKYIEMQKTNVFRVACFSSSMWSYLVLQWARIITILHTMYFFSPRKVHYHSRQFYSGFLYVSVKKRTDVFPKLFKLGRHFIIFSNIILQNYRTHMAIPP